MGVKCTHYKLCSVQSKLVYFLQFWGMKHFLGPVCDIWVDTLYCIALAYGPKNLYRITYVHKNPAFDSQFGKFLSQLSHCTASAICLHKVNRACIALLTNSITNI